jgi:hypothetical protein
MNEHLRIFQDAAKPATGGSDITRREVRRAAAERERRAAENAQGLALHPAAIIAVGGTEQPVERLMGLQRAVAKAMQFVAATERIRLGLERIGMLRYRLR